MEGLETLLDFDGEIIFVDPEGHWIKFVVKEIQPTKHQPHGLKYSLTLHDHANNRIFGIDNAHSPKIKKRKRFSARIITWDHVHKYDKIEEYQFDSPAQLIEDFFIGVETMLNRG